MAIAIIGDQHHHLGQQDISTISPTREVSEKLGGYFSTFGGNPAACAIGLSVLEVGHAKFSHDTRHDHILQVISNEKLVSSAKMVGRSLQSSLRKLVDK